MKNVFPKLSLFQQMVFMAAVFAAGFFICMAIAVGVIEKVKVTGPVYREIVQGKDLVADILPPPEYIIESYLVVQQALNGMEESKRLGLLKRIRKLKDEYEERHAYWTKELRGDDIREIMLAGSYKPAIAFYEIAIERFFPAIQRGDIKEAHELLAGPLTVQYEAHRSEIDKAVTLMEKRNSSIENKTAALLKKSHLLLAAICLTVIAMSGFVILVISQSVIRSFAYCAEISDRVASGDLTVQVSVHGKGSIHQMLTSLNNMVGNLRGIVGNLTAASMRIDAAAAQLATSSAQIATGAEELAAQAGTVATASEEMAATSTEITMNCSLAADESKSANDTALAGAAVIDGMISTILHIGEKMQESAKTVEELGERSDQIGAIIGTIEDIADQTNLLALNAAIEAARAGEHGRGFAVVADEVRALAERTTKATGEIGEMIKSNQLETKGAVSAMEERVREVETGCAEAGKSGEALLEIQTRVSAVTTQVSQMAVAAEQQTSTITEITNNIQQITQVVQETAKGAHESASSAVQLAALAEELQQLVGQFRLAA